MRFAVVLPIGWLVAGTILFFEFMSLAPHDPALRLFNIITWPSSLIRFGGHYLFYKYLFAGAVQYFLAGWTLDSFLRRDRG